MKNRSKGSYTFPFNQMVKFSGGRTKTFGEFW
nr:MAG TPA: hypothetical protein [Caudoviricetes sp.]